MEMIDTQLSFFCLITIIAIPSGIPPQALWQENRSHVHDLGPFS